MMIKIRGDDPSKEKKKLSGGKILIKEYVDYDHIDDGYRPSSKLWGSHYKNLKKICLEGKLQSSFLKSTENIRIGFDFSHVQLFTTFLLNCSTTITKIPYF